MNKASIIFKSMCVVSSVIKTIIVLFFICHASVAIAFNESQPLKVRINSFDIQGNTVFSAQTLINILKEYIANNFPDSELNLEDMKLLTDQITLTYKEKGYFLARCYLPKQDIQGGQLKLIVAEGVLNKIEVSGNKYYSEKLLKGYFEPKKTPYIINEYDLEKGLILINDLPKNKTELLLTKGEKKGSVNIVLKSSDSFASQFQLAYNNYGAEHISKNRYSLTGKITDPYGGMTFFAKGISGDNPQDCIVGFTNLDIPLNLRGTQMSFSFIKSTAQLGQGLDVLSIEGQTDIYGALLKQPIIFKRNLRINANIGINHTFSETTAMDSVAIKTYKLNSVKANIDLNMLDHYFGKTQAYCAYQVSIVDKGPGIEKTNKALHKVSIYASRMQHFSRLMHFSFRISGQWSSDDLIPIDQFSIGGYEAVRGHAPSSFMGDMGYNLSLEWMQSPKSDQKYFGQPLSSILQWGLFIDHGWIRLNKEPLFGSSSKSLGGCGLGLRLFYKDILSCFMDLAFPINKQDDGDDVTFYFSLKSNF